MPLGPGQYILLPCGGHSSTKRLECISSVAVRLPIDDEAIVALAKGSWIFAAIETAERAQAALCPVCSRKFFGSGFVDECLRSIRGDA